MRSRTTTWSEVVADLIARLERGDFDTLLHDNYFDPQNATGSRMDIAHFLQGAARHREEQKQEGVCRRAAAQPDRVV